MVNLHSSGAQADLGSKIKDWVDVVGGKKRGKVYGLGSQAHNALRGESSSSGVSSNS